MTTQTQRVGIYVSRLFAADLSLRASEPGKGYSGYRDFYSGHIAAYETAIVCELLGKTYVPLWAHEAISEWLDAQSQSSKESASGCLVAPAPYVRALRNTLRRAEREADKRYEERRALLDA